MITFRDKGAGRRQPDQGHRLFAWPEAAGPFGRKLAGLLADDGEDAGSGWSDVLGSEVSAG
jgi:hypothetical protein